MKKLLFLALVFSAAIMSCRKDNLTTNIDTNDPFPVPTEYVKSSIAGTVVDESDLAVPDALVTLKTSSGDAITKTDINGYFSFIDKTINSKGAYVKVEKTGYFHGSRTIHVRLNTQNYVRIQLLSSASTQTINSATGGTADYGSHSITLPANAVVIEATKTPYHGVVNVAAKFLDPTNANFAIQMPGRLQGVTTDNQLVGLRSMGMLAVELTSNTGEKLQIKSGSKATISSVVPAAILAKAPATIPLWYFDEAQGLWIEEGQSSLNNGRYTGEVSHFSFWNHDYQVPIVEIDFCVKDQNGNPVPNVRLCIKMQSSAQYGYGYTDNTGHIIGLVPKDEPLFGLVYRNSICSNPLDSLIIGPFSSNGSYCFTIQSSQLSNYTITGKLINCNGNPVTSGYVRIDGRYDYYPTDSNGEYTINLFDCSPTNLIILFGYDFENEKESDPTTLALSSGANAAPTIQVCNTLQKYFYCTPPLDTIINLYVEVSVFPDTFGNGTFFRLRSFPSNAFFDLFTQGTIGIGAYTPHIMSISHNYRYYGCNDNVPPLSCSGMTVNITEYEPVGGYVAGNFNGVLYDQLSTPQPVSGSFRCKL